MRVVSKICVLGYAFFKRLNKKTHIFEKNAYFLAKRIKKNLCKKSKIIVSDLRSSSQQNRNTNATTVILMDICSTICFHSQIFNKVSNSFTQIFYKTALKTG